MSSNRTVFLAFVILGLTDLGKLQSVIADEADRIALTQIFGERLLQQNAVRVTRSAQQDQGEEQYTALMRWVLPGDGHGFRIGGTIQRNPERSDDRADQQLMDLSEYPESDWIVCPARELVRTAKELNRLADLKARISAVDPSSELQAMAQRTLVILVDVANGDRGAVELALADRFSEMREWNQQNAHEKWWSDLLVLWSVMEEPRLSELVIEAFFGVYPQLRLYNSNPAMDTIADYLALLEGHRGRQTHSEYSLSAEPLRKEFDVFSRVSAFSHARAAPLVRFCFDDRGAVKVSGHEVDYLASVSPLSGVFEVVGDVATRSGSFSQLMIDGVSCRPTSGQSEVSIERFGGGSRIGTIPQALEPTDNRTLLRVTRNDDRTEHFCNGRPMLIDATKASSSPWAAIQSWRRARSETSDFRVAGTPRVPDSIDLLADESLSGWTCYYQSATGTWRRVVDDDGMTMIVDERSSCPVGSCDEELLYYVRPLIWDARVQYQFQYEKGVCSVDPCLGRSVFQIRPEGVRIHRLTDGRYERSNLRPDNTIPLNRSESDPLTGATGKPNLRVGWNQAEVLIQGDTLKIVLNGDVIVQRAIESSTVRRFGFFHYRDMTRAAVRDVRLSGDWPDSIASPGRQALSSRLVAGLEEASANLPEVWSHDFRQGAPSDFFHLGGNTERVSQRSDGLHMNRLDDSDKLALDFCGIIDGDFDIIASFKDLKIGDQAPTWHCGFGMATHLQNEDRSRLDICLRRDRLNSLHHIAFSHNEVNTHGGIRWIRDWNLRDQSSSGRLRLIRRDDTVYGFFASGDSTCFRHIGSTTIPSGPVPPQMLRLYTVGGDGMHVSGTWVSLTIRAERIDRLKPADESAVLQSLDVSREEKPDFQVDFAKQSYSESGLTLSSGSPEDLVPTSRGWLIKAIGGTSFRRTALETRMRPTGAFDAEWEFEVERAHGTVAEGMTSEAVLGVRLTEAEPIDDDPTHLSILEATLIARYKPDGRIVLRPRMVALRKDGKLAYLPLRMRQIDSPTKYRILQKDKRILFLYRDVNSTVDQIIASYPLKYPVIARSAGIWAIGSRNHGEAHVLSKRLAICYHETDEN